MTITLWSYILGEAHNNLYRYSDPRCLRSHAVLNYRLRLLQLIADLEQWDD